MGYCFEKSFVLIASENQQARKINNLPRCVHPVAPKPSPWFEPIQPALAIHALQDNSSNAIGLDSG
jgi:hypothetical protein